MSYTVIAFRQTRLRAGA